MLRKCIVQERINSRQYLVKDIFTSDLLVMRVSAKQTMGNTNFETGEEVYIACSPYEPEKCSLYTSTDFKMNDNGSMYVIKMELDRKHRKMMEE